ncbi:MAG: ATP synthase F1 subunit epsilon [Ilumatobacteraceae bacterium]
MAESTSMQVEVVSPERMLFSGQASQVITRTLGGGEIAFLPGHAPFLAALIPNHTRVYLADGSILDVAVHGGFVEVSNNKVSILTDFAELGSEIDKAAAQADVERLEEQLRHAHDALGAAELSKAHARLAAAGGIGGAGVKH